MKKRTKNIQGFTLIEMVIVIATVAMLVGGALGVISAKVESNRVKETRTQMIKIMETIDKYYEKNGYIPCPSDGTDALTNTGFGRGLGTGLGEDGVTESCTDNDLIEEEDGAAQGVVMGVVPIRELGLPVGMMFDGWRNKITYVVDERMTHNTTTNAGGFDDNTGDISIRDITDAGDWQHKVAYVLISHGKRYHGSWPLKGGNRHVDTNAQAYEDKNGEATVGESAFDKEFISSIYSYDKFDDMVMFKSKWQIGTKYDTVKE